MNVVREETLPNGSKFAYGYDENDNVTAITQSTEEGEENSTQRKYYQGQLTELHSGNTLVEYSYDYTNGYKKRVESISLNGQEGYMRKEYNVECTDTNYVACDNVKITNAKQENVTVYSDIGVFQNR